MQTVKNILFLSNLFWVVLATEERKPSSSIEFRDFDKKCPKFWSGVLGDHIEDFATNCSSRLREVVKNRELSIHKDICLLVNEMLSVVCLHIPNPENTLFLLAKEFSAKYLDCPINMNLTEKHLELRMINSTILLANEANCKKVCYDLNKFEKQCSVLIRVSHYFGDVMLQNSTPATTPVKTAYSAPETKLSGYSENFLEKTAEAITPVKSKFGEISNTETKAKIDDKKSSKDYNKHEVSQYKQTDHDGEQNYQFGDSPHQKAESNLQENNGGSIHENSRKQYNSNEVVPISRIVYDQNDISKKNLFQTDVIDEGKSDIQALITQKNRFGSSQLESEVSSNGYFQSEDSHFYFYFLMISSVIIISYLAFHNKNKILAYALEGRNDRRNRRRSNSAKYRKLESNLEDVISSNTVQTSAPNVVY